LLDQEERPDVAFQKLESHTYLHGQVFLTHEIST
jgi:hypothetical protein